MSDESHHAEWQHPEIDDPALAPSPVRWRPTDRPTEKLCRSLEAMRNLRVALATVAATPTDKRAAMQAIVPVYNLACSLRDLFLDIQGNGFGQPAERRALAKQYKAFIKAVPTDKGPLKTARDKIAAHLDKDTDHRAVWSGFDMTAILGWIRASLAMLNALLALDDLYHWSREDGATKMRVDGIEVRLAEDEHGNPFIPCIALTPSPRYAVADEAASVVRACDEIRQRLNLPAPTTWRLPPKE